MLSQILLPLRLVPGEFHWMGAYAVCAYRASVARNIGRCGFSRYTVLVLAAAQSFVARARAATTTSSVEIDYRHAQANCHFAKTFITRPQLGLRGKPYRAQQMGIQVADAASEQEMALDELKGLGIVCDNDVRQVLQRIEHRAPVAQAAEGDFADHEWMRKHFSSLKQACQVRIAATQMVDSNRGVDQNHELHGLCATPRGRFQVRLAAAETSQSPSAFPFDQRKQCLSDHAGFLLQTGIGLGFGHQFFIECDGCAHVVHLGAGDHFIIGAAFLGFAALGAAEVAAEHSAKFDIDHGHWV
jgi:hypothetical protein